MRAEIEMQIYKVIFLSKSKILTTFSDIEDNWKCKSQGHNLIDFRTGYIENLLIFESIFGEILVHGRKYIIKGGKNKEQEINIRLDKYKISETKNVYERNNDLIEEKETATSEATHAKTPNSRMSQNNLMRLVNIGSQRRTYNFKKIL
ncbi:hypothetical protein CWI38_0157p0030 [Hamiltosporidium tvaerminnensis]|uniref:Uncharacterized protein n=1 Tax=Hamiltosporidium tvaerminnensis TaxID=1176355 RepID=A0A4Q9M0A7_9MICR|nr:hypothetical protein CWI38_0157p0030 [Hamiltosporidium tvaerminnensis]